MTIKNKHNNMQNIKMEEWKTVFLYGRLDKSRFGATPVGRSSALAFSSNSKILKKNNNNKINK